MARIGDNPEAATGPDSQAKIVDLVPFLLVTDVERSIAFYESSASQSSSVTSPTASFSSPGCRRHRRPS